MALALIMKTLSQVKSPSDSGRKKRPFADIYSIALAYKCARPLERANEKGIATIKKRSMGYQVHFLLWLPKNRYDRRYLGIRVAIILFASIVITTVFFLQGLSISSSILILVSSLFVTLLAIRFWCRIYSSHIRFWEHCTGFLVIDPKLKRIMDKDLYHGFFSDYVTLEEVRFRPPIGKILPEFLRKILRNMRIQSARTNRRIETKKPKTNIDREILKLHYRLTGSEELLNPLLDDEDAITVELRDLSYSVLRDFNIQRIKLIEKLKQYRRIEIQIVSGLEKRIEIYDQWLQIWAKKGVRIRFSRSSAFISAIGNLILIFLNRRISPTSLISRPFLLYLIDNVSGVRGLKRTVKIYKIRIERITRYLDRINPNFNSNLIRF